MGARGRRFLGILAGSLAALGATACGPNQHAEAGPMAADTARGLVAVVGADPATRVVMRTPDGDLPLTGEHAAALRRAAGIEVWAAGRRAADGALEVEAYRVRSADGLEAVDGVLEMDGDAAVLVTPAGDRIRYTPVPPGLRPLEGRRVWIAGPPGGEPQAWGSLDPAS